MSDIANFSRQIELPSSVVSGLTVLFFDIVLLGIIKAEAQFLCATANLHLIYDRREAVFPTKSRLGCLTGSPVGHKTLARCFSLLIAAITTSVIILGFSINGKTVKPYETETYRSVIVNSDVPPTIDFEQEFALIPHPRGRPEIAISKRVSAFLALHTCIRHNFTHSTQYAYAYRDISIDQTKVDLSTHLSAECVTKDRFQGELILRRVPMVAPVNPITCEFSGVDVSLEDDAITGHATFSPSSPCSMNISRLFCFRAEITTCAAAGILKGPGGNKAYIVIVPNIDAPTETSIADIPQMRSQELYDRVAMNIAFFSGIMEGALAYYLSQVVFCDVEYNVTLRRTTGDREISEIDLRLAAPTLVFISATAVVLAIIAFVLWLYVVYLKDRSLYNSFCNVPEVLALADEGTMSRVWDRKGQSKFIGVRTDCPLLGVLTAQKCSSSEWTEDDIQ